MPAQLEQADLGAVHGAQVTEGFLAEVGLFAGRQELRAKASGNAVVELAHQRIVSVPQQSVYTKNTGEYFLNPVYTDPTLTKQQNKQVVLLQTRLKEEEMSNDSTEDVEMMLKAVSHRLRRRIMRTALDEPENALSPREMTERLDEVLSNVSYHVRVLSDFNVLTLDRTELVRGAVQHFYRPSEAFQDLHWVSAMLAVSSDAPA